ncbi:MAG: cardiolipin synthase [Pontiellaceae bacterium]|nr:cardiolipin synthase [Pontiellaceae bacterium]MBN2783404.1 cardiolipin synthase [Pontiellaceae bacterium]
MIISTLLHIVAFTGVCLHALQRRRNASATILWIFVAWSFPLIGPLLYLSFGIDRVPNKGLRKKAANQLMMDRRRTHHKDASSFVAWHYGFSSNYAEIKNEFSQRLNRSLNSLNTEHPLLDGNAIQPLCGGDEAYPLMIEAIRSATKHIHLQSFIIYRDATGRQFLDELRKKADEGVEVRLLFDRFGSTHAYLSGMFRKYRRIPNFHVCGWTQANPLKRQFQINLRNHRKNLIVDGHIAFFGGVNISGENTSGNDRKAIRDYHFKVEGPLVHELQLSFLRDWFFMTAEPIDQLLNEIHFPKILSTGHARARLIDSGPSDPRGLASETFFNTITLACRQILIVTPYFVPTNEIIQALRSAAHRGVDVRLVLPEKNNHHYAGMASKALYEELLTSGVRIYERNPPFIHAKALVADDSIALVGTANLDVRSLELNYETTVLIEDDNAIGKLKQMIHEDMDESKEILLNTWIKRPAGQKLAENLCALMTPVL